MAMNLEGFRPMKSASPEQDYDFSKLHWPMWASPKVDGWRAVVLPGQGAVTNTLKEISNRYVHNWFKQFVGPLAYMDGEIVVGNINDPRSFNQTQSALSSYDGEPDFTYLVFDYFEAGHMCGFGIRKEDAKNMVKQFLPRESILRDAMRVQTLEQVLIETYEQLVDYEVACLAKGYEGVMLRSPQGKYKFGRSTLREEGMIKIKRFKDAEALIIGWEPLERNLNDPTIDALGLQKRGYSKDGKMIDDFRVGRFRLRGINGQFKNVEFWCGSGLDDADRVMYREQLRKYQLVPGTYSYMVNTQELPGDQPLGKICTYKYQVHGSLDAPRTPIWKGIRYDH